MLASATSGRTFFFMSTKLPAPGAALALALACLAPNPAQAQATDARRLTLEESEAYQMGLELAFACSPYRHRRADGSESTIRREGDALAGTAIHFRSIEGTYVVLERYDEELDGHCLVLGWFGGPLEPRRYDVGQLAMSTVEEEVARGQHSFFAMSLVRKPEENAMLVVESGSLEIAGMEDGRVVGTFELAGFLADGNGADRVGDASWAGSFSAVRGAD
jgi:hypothetical protein